MTDMPFPPGAFSILVVDDDAIFCDLVLADLVSKHLTVVACHTLEDAKEAVSRHHFDITIIDNHLPDGEGAALIPFLQRAGLKPYILMVSADEDVSSIAKSFASGVHDYLVKPVSISMLWEKIRNLMSFKKANIELANKNRLLTQFIDEKSQEEALAQHVYDNMATAQNSLPGYVDVKSEPMTTFSGDTIFCPSTPTGKVQIFLADAMGHGLAAAICILPLISIARAMASKGKALDEIFHEINRKLYFEIPDDRFIAVLGLEICPYTETVHVINAGLPDILCSMQNGELLRFKSRSMPLGIMSPEDFSVTAEQISLPTVSQIALFSDGLIEQTNAEGQALTLNRLIEQAEALASEGQSLIQLMDICVSHAQGRPIEDDITLCVIDGQTLREELASNEVSVSENFGELDYRFQLNGQAIVRVDVLSQVMFILQNAELPKSLCQKTFTVLAELVNNAVDHGILQIDSSLKNDIEGFSAYLSLRDERIAQLQENDQINIHIYTNSTTFIEVTVEDSGPGFCRTEVSEQQQTLSGRGLALLDALCESVERNAKGNLTTISLVRN